MHDGSNGSTRREFLYTGGAALGAALLTTASAAEPRGAASRRVVVGIMGVNHNGRGSQLAPALARLAGVHVAYVCDVDERNVPRAVELVSKNLRDGLPPPQGVRDFRRILDDKAVDAIVISAPDHWHAPAAILACSAGKHVYVEKPCSHDAHEGEMLVAGARKHRRLVQHGTQRRTWPAIREAIDRLRAGDIGRVISAKTYYWSNRPTIGRGRPIAVPQWLDWDLWQGPAPLRPYLDNIVHYKWHWRWHWGTGEIGNNGVHMIDLARWGLGVDRPVRVSYTGGKYRFPDDDQETPDTSVASFEFAGDKFMTWENRSWAGQTPLDPTYDVLFAGDAGFLSVRGGGYAIHDLKGKLRSHAAADGGDASHLQNFIDAIRGEAPLNAPIDEGYQSALLCHLGNISYRTGRTLHPDPKTGAVSGDRGAMELWGRSYREGWAPTV